MSERNKKVVYGILAAVLIVASIAFSFLLNARDKKTIDEMRSPVTTPSALPALTPGITSMPTIVPTKLPSREVTPEERSVGQPKVQYEEEKKEVEERIDINKPKFTNITEEIRTQFLANDIDNFWHEFGLYIVATLGSQSVSEVTFFEQKTKDDVINCPMEIKDPSGDQLFVMGVYNTTYKYYEFYLTTDVYTYDTSPETGEGGL